MTINVKVPPVGESVTEGRIARWIRKNGEAVKLDEPIFELESDKAAQEIAAPAAGVLATLVPEGEIVKIGQVVARVDPAGVPAATPAPAAKPAPQPVTAVPAAIAPEKKTEIVMAPAARVLVAEKNLDPATIAATGPGGRITKTDVLAHEGSGVREQGAGESTKAKGRESNGSPHSQVTVKPPSSLAPGPWPLAPGARIEHRQPMTMIRRRIAERLLDSQNSTATLTTFNEIDMTAASDLRTRYNEKFEKKYGVKLGFMSIFVKAAVEALKVFPVVNARIDGTDIVYQNFYDIGVAVSTDKGLMVPVLRDADKLGFAEIEKSLVDVATRAREGRVKPEEMMGGTFTVSNGGIFGSLMSTPILNPPQTAILGMHAIKKRPVVVNDAIVIRPMMYVALSYDHRLLDGRESVQFLVRIKECVEGPERMLFDI